MANYRMLFDLHTHTAFTKETAFASAVQVTHAVGTVLENVMAARDKGLKAIGISNHGPGHIVYGMPLENVQPLRDEIEQVRRQFPEMGIYLGVEANIIEAAGKLDVSEENSEQFDYIMAGYHYGIFGSEYLRPGLIHAGNWIYDNFQSSHALFDKILGGENDATLSDVLLRKNTEMTVYALHRNKPKVLTHPGDKGYFDIRAIAAACAETGTWMEINNSHRSLSVEGIQAAMEYDVQFVIGSDAHRPEDVGEFEQALERAQEAGLSLSRIVNIEEVTRTAAKRPEKENESAPPAVGPGQTPPWETMTSKVEPTLMKKAEPEELWPGLGPDQKSSKWEAGREAEPEGVWPGLEPAPAAAPEPVVEPVDKHRLFDAAHMGGVALRPESAARPGAAKEPESMPQPERCVIADAPDAEAEANAKGSGPARYAIRADYRSKSIGQAYRRRRGGRGLSK